MSARLVDVRFACAAAAIALATTGCTFDTSGLPGAPADAGVIEGPPDAATCVPWQASNVEPCSPALPPPAPLALAGAIFTFDTDSGVTTPVGAVVPSALVEQPGGGELRVIVASGFTVAADAQLIAVGSRPLLVLVHGDARVDGVIDVAARGVMPRRPGAGGNYADCGAGGGRDGGAVVANTGGGGGAGGGGFGADGDVGTEGAGRGRGSPGARGVANGSASLTPLRGGCAGGAGGIGIGPATGGPRGDGGGAVQIAARGRIVVNGQIRAGGAGGGGAAALRGGGGGGGSGGAIFLEGEHVDLAPTAALCANGGAGGEGGDTGIGGLPGEDGTCSETVRAKGGSSGNNGGNGGAGGNAAVSDGDPATSARGDGVGGGTTGGGGGGAGVGRVRIRGRASRVIPETATITPAAEI